MDDSVSVFAREAELVEAWEALEEEISLAVLAELKGRGAAAEVYLEIARERLEDLAELLMEGS